MSHSESQAEKIEQVLSSHVQEEGWLKDYAAKGLEQQVRAIHGRYRRAEMSFGRMAEELGLNVWELTHLLEELGLPTTNLPSSD